MLNPPPSGQQSGVDLLAPLHAFDGFQRRHAVLAIPVAVLKKFSDDQAGNLAALMTFFAFSSLFPLLLVFTAVLGFVLQGDPQAQRDVLDSALHQIPGFQVKPGTLHGSGLALVVGIVGALLAGLGVTMAAQNAFNRVYAVPHRERPNFLFARLRGIGLLVVVGVLQVLSTVASGLVSGGLGGPLLVVAGIALSLVLNVALFYASFRLLIDSSVPTRHLLPGVGIATVLWTGLQSLAGVYAAHVRHVNSGYGIFAVVLGLLAWLFLGARVVVYSAELNTVLTRRLWPRSLFEPSVPADDKTLTALAKIEERSDREHVEVEFEPSTGEERRERADP